jgi:hypothetical protein
MPARFVEKRIISAVEELDPMEREQLRMAGKLYDGVDRPAADRLAGGVVEGDGSLFDTELWKVVDGDRHLYDAWFYMGDSGTFFHAGSTDLAAEVIQSGLECEDPEVRAQLGPAMVEARLLPQSDSAYAEFAAMLTAQQAAGAGGRAPAGKPAAKKPGARKPAAKAVAKKAMKKPAAKKPAAKAVAKKTAAKKAMKKPAAKKPATKKAAAKKPAAKKPAKKPSKKAAKRR